MTTTPAPTSYSTTTTASTTEKPYTMPHVGTPSPRPLVVHAGTPTAKQRTTLATPSLDSSINEVTDDDVHFLPTVAPKKSKSYYPTTKQGGGSKRPYTYVRELKTKPVSYFRGKSVEWGDSYPAPSAAVEEISRTPPQIRREDRARWVSVEKKQQLGNVGLRNTFQKRLVFTFAYSELLIADILYVA